LKVPEAGKLNGALMTNRPKPPNSEHVWQLFRRYSGADQRLLEHGIGKRDVGSGVLQVEITSAPT
jgi:hypothetical protein